MMEQCPSCGTDLPANGQSCAYCGYTQLTTISTIATPKQNVWVSPQTHEQLEKPVSKEITPNDKPSHAISETTKTVSPLVKGFILAAIGFIILGSIVTTFYFLNRPQPVISISSKYQIGDTLVGAAGTVFHIDGSKFSGSSAITFLLDGIPTMSSSTIYSDANGNINVDLAVIEGWPLGQHLLTARDAHNNITEKGFTIMIVPPGQAHTPGPNGAPPDDASFRIRITFSLIINAETGSFFAPENAFIDRNITGRPDPAGGTICQPGTITKSSVTSTQNGEQVTQTSSVICEDSLYKGGKYIVTEKYTEKKLVFSSGRTCTLRQPYNAISVGTFINPTTMRGETKQPDMDFDCTDSTKAHMAGLIGSWEGHLVTN